MAKVTLRDVETGEDTTHAAGTGGGAGYATLCGCSDDDGQMQRVPTPQGALIDCGGCLTTFNEARKLRAKDFA